MGVNWAAGLIRWEPHKGKDGRAYPLNHLHPFRVEYDLPASKKHAAKSLLLHFAFSLHTFTHKITAADDEAEDYQDNRETRAFCHDRYARSFALPEVARELHKRACYTANSLSGRINYVTIDTGKGDRYGVFFDLKRWREQGPNAILIMIQSAFVLNNRQNPAQDKIGLNALLGRAIRG